MKPPALRRICILAGVASLFGLALLAGCNRSCGDDDDVLASKGPCKPTPKTDRSSRKTLSAYNAVSEYLKSEDPAMRDRLQRAAERFVRDKDDWRLRLKKREKDLAPKIAKLRDQLARAEGLSSEALRNLKEQLASLEGQRADAERKLSQLEAVTADTWKAMREQLGIEDEPVTAAANSKPARQTTRVPQENSIRGTSETRPY